MGTRPRHPSGRPIRRTHVVERRRWNVPDVGPVTPRLKAPDLAHPIGFHTAVLPGQQDYDDAWPGEAKQGRTP